MAESCDVEDAKSGEEAVGRIMWVLIDGIGDVSCKELDGKTPLQAATVPNLDALSDAGFNGLLDSVAPGLACGSDTAHMSLFGYPPRSLYRGRGSFEAMGSGLDMKLGDVAFKCNFATLNPVSRVVERRRVDRAFPDWGLPLCSALHGLKLPSFPDVQVAVQYATEHRCAVRLRGPRLSDVVSGTDPLSDGLPLLRSEPLDDSEEAARTAAVINELVQEMESILAAHEINVARRVAGLPQGNMVLLRGPGQRLDVESMEERYGLRCCMVAPTAIIAGLGKTIGMTRLACRGGTGDYRTDLSAKAAALLAALSSEAFDFGFLHIKAVDDAGHDRSLSKKVEWLQKADAMLSLLIDGGNDNDWICVTGDHSTLITTGDHSCEPVPIVIAQLAAVRAGCSSAVDCVRSFDEIAAAKGCLGRFCGSELMPLLCGLRNGEIECG
eukprot:PLAT11057.1.p1 GENE.PLAT11057.1~~PLAT11057.1.p1  ORF type:complete len:439 (-),score=82.22 PLAT11057.1:20-1336(-)